MIWAMEISPNTVIAAVLSQTTTIVLITITSVDAATKMMSVKDLKIVAYWEIPLMMTMMLSSMLMII